MSKGRILIIDDNPKNIQVLAHVLHEHGYELEIGISGYEALNILKDESFDLLMLDVMMPELNGFETCVKIRLTEKHKSMPIVFISAKNDSHSMVRGFQVGGQDYVTKPFDNEELLARVKTQIDLKKSKEELYHLNLILEQKVEERTNELDSLNRIKGKYLSFIGEQVSTPLKSINKVLNVIKNSSESSTMAEMISLLGNSVDKLEVITKMAQLMSKIQIKKNSLALNNVPLLNYVENFLLSINQHLNMKKLELIIDINEDANVNLNIEHCEQSIIILLKTVLNYVDDRQMLIFSSNEDEKYISLSIKVPVNDNFGGDISQYPEDMVVYIAYAETIMTILNGKFTIEEQNKIFTIEWYFLNR